MHKKLAVLTFAAILATAGAARGQDDGAPNILDDLLQRSTLTDNWFGVGPRLEEEGVSVALSLTQIYQLNLQSDNTLVHRHAGRYTGVWDLEVELDLETLGDIPDAIVYALAEGSWSDGIDESSIESLFGANDSAGGDRSVDLIELWYEQGVLDGMLRFRLGKLAIDGGFECRGCTVAFDANMLANDETFQFINGALVNNPQMPFPDEGMGAVVYFQPLEWAYASAGVSDAQADRRETGFNTAFHDEDYFVALFETGVAPQFTSANGPLQGTYRFGLWYDPQPKDRLDGTGAKRDDIGFYLSFDQVLCLENDKDDQGLGGFVRYGYAHGDLNEVRCFWSLGAQYQGLIPGRDDDILGFGFAQGELSNEAAFEKDYEAVYEVYYNIFITPHLRISPDLQVIRNAGGADANAVVAGFRAQLDI